MSPEQNSEQTQKPEKLQIPKSREIFAGDINAAVITVQQVTGVEITPDWWDQHVQKNGTVQDTNEILDNFDEAFSEYILGLEGFKAPEFSDRNLAELEAIEEIKAALLDGRLKEKDLEGYIADLGAWLDQEFPTKDSEPDSKSVYEVEVAKLLNPERIPLDINNGLGISFELNNPNIIIDSSLREAVMLSVIKLEEMLLEECLDSRLYSGLKVVFCEGGIISGGGQALAREGLVILDISKPSAIQETEDHLIERGFLDAGDWSKLSVPNNSAIGLTLIHELGHIFEFKRFGDYGIAFSELDTVEAPTRYGRQNPSEDFAESFAYLIFGGHLPQSRIDIIKEKLNH